MKVTLFIDANIYLRFFDTNQSNFKKLLKSLVSIKDKVFVTKQIENEVKRNKTQVFDRSFLTYIKQAGSSFNNILLPEHIDPELINWNKKRNKLIIDNNNLVLELKRIYQNTIKKIISSKDDVSVQLNKVFKSSISETSEEYSKALKRKEVGNPPGKKTDSLGDQFNWEQLLTEVKSTDTVIIVTGDNDYYVNVNNEIYLNPILQEELLEINANLSIHCFDKLSSALVFYNQLDNSHITLPAASVIDKINVEESDENEISIEDKHTIYYNQTREAYLINDEIQRLQYLYGHALIGTIEYEKRMAKLGINIRKE